VTDAAGQGRLAELTIALSLATDLGTGQPMEHGLRTCMLSLSAAEALGLDAEARSCVYHVALLRFVGCTSDASETAVLAGGDDLAFNASMAPMLNAQPRDTTRYFVRHLAEELPLHRRTGRVLRAMADPAAGDRSLSGHCEVGARLASRLGMGADVCHALAHAYERWDGRGLPEHLAGEEVPQAIRIVAVARDVELWARQAGWPAAAEVLASRRGRAYDPAVVDVFLGDGQRWLATLADDDDLRQTVLDAEPAPARTVVTAARGVPDVPGVPEVTAAPGVPDVPGVPGVPAARGVTDVPDVTGLPGTLDAVLGAVADFVDLKSPFLRGHSPGVAALAAAAATAAGMSAADAATLGRAGLVHDIGRVGVASGIWDRPGTLATEQWERVRMHAYLGERVLHHSELLAPLADLAARHHERADGSGYHRGASGDQLLLGARILAAADAYQAMTEHRPHRPALSPSAAAAELLDEVDAGRFGRPEVDAVLAAAGHPTRPAQVPRPAGLTEREVDVLRLIARGHANKEVAARLGISAKTVGHHVEHIYAKAGVNTRAGATLYAMENGLLSS